MTSDSPVATLERVNLRDIWGDEARDFTPWLASEEGLALLGDEIGRKLELIKREAAVGPFSADIVARVIGEEDHKVVIENQLGKTDHDHLGKMITYAAGLGAKTVIWVSDRFCEEHREALNWLNQNTGEGFAFWGFEIRAYKIDGSRPAPQFSPVSRPITSTKALRSDVSSIERKSADALMAMAKSRHVDELTKILLRLGQDVLRLGQNQIECVWTESTTQTYGGSFRCWRNSIDGKSKMVLGINVSGERKHTPDGKLDLWVPVLSIASVADISREEACETLEHLPIWLRESTDWIIRIGSGSEAEKVVAVVANLFEEHPGFYAAKPAPLDESYATSSSLSE